MLPSLKYFIFLINISAVLCNVTSEVEFNATNEILAIKSQLADLKAEQDRLRLFQSYVGLHYVSSCAEATANSQSSGIYDIYVPNYIQNPFKVACDAETQDGGWTTILNRADGSVDFYRNWTYYKNGFGNLDGEFFLGLDKIHALTAEYSQELLVILEDHLGTEVYEKYEKFAIGDESEDYVLHTLGAASGTAGDSLRENYRQKFSTYDRDNDAWSGGSCATGQQGAWWYNSCTSANLAGTYNGKLDQGIFWTEFRTYISLEKATMMIRPRKTT
ncbi:angiopoietin-related protein 2-like [Drosophila nasuta]|uniref:angiopoietin-related protein 2-like n=1 Tax=Drosophila nasuta TaxID=42062 RepID=UPI00295E33B6|nr:angiopoietin-related protein 2-like [Drosophila nasuta]